MARGTGGAGNDDRVELEHLLPQCEILSERLSRRERHGPLDGTVADHLRSKAVLGHGHIHQRVPAVVPGERAEHGTHQANLRADDRLTVLFRDSPADGGGRRLGANGGGVYEQRDGNAVEWSSTWQDTTKPCMRHEDLRGGSNSGEAPGLRRKKRHGTVPTHVAGGISSTARRRGIA